MLENDSRSLAAGGAGVVLISLLTLPSLFRTVSHFRSSTPKPLRYEDKDGIATDESIDSYSAKFSKVLLTIFNLLGLSTAIALAVLGTLDSRMVLFIEPWLNVAQWVSPRDVRRYGKIINSTQFLILIQTVGTLTVRDTVHSYALGIYTVFSSVLLLSILLFQEQLLISKSSTSSSSVEVGLRAIQLFAVVLTGFASVCIPRRPQVYYGEKPVDRMLTVSALGRYSKSV
jgi:hypothetical protein